MNTKEKKCKKKGVATNQCKKRKKCNTQRKRGYDEDDYDHHRHYHACEDELDD